MRNINIVRLRVADKVHETIDGVNRENFKIIHIFGPIARETYGYP